MSPKTTQDTHVLLVPCAEMTHVQLNMHVRTTQALDNMRVPRVEFRDIRLTRECMWFQHVLFCSAQKTGFFTHAHFTWPFTLQIPLFSPTTVHVQVKASPGQVGGVAGNCPATFPKIKYKRHSSNGRRKRQLAIFIHIAVLILSRLLKVHSRLRCCRVWEL